MTELLTLGLSLIGTVVREVSGAIEATRAGKISADEAIERLNALSLRIGKIPDDLRAELAARVKHD